MKVIQWMQMGDRASSAEVTKNPMTSLGRGGAPPEKLMRKTFVLNIYDDKSDVQLVSLAGNVGDRAIYKENQDETIQKIVKVSPLNKNSTSILLWPDMKDEVVTVSRRGTLRVDLRIDGKEPLALQFYYPKFTTNVVTRLVSSLGKKVKARLQAKFPGKDDGIKYMQTLRAMTDKGTAVYLTFSVTKEQKDQMQLVDVEFLVPLNQLKDVASASAAESDTESSLSEQEKKIVDNLKTLDLTEAPITYDTTNIASMTGLTMALEYAQAQIAAGIIEPDPALFSAESFDHAAAVVRKHARALNDGKTFTKATVPIEVNAAAYTAVNALQDMQSIEAIFAGRSSNTNKYLAKLSDTANTTAGDAGAAKQALAAATALQTKMSNARGSKLFSRSRKGAIRKDIEDWEAAIRKFSGRNSERLTLMQPALDILNEAKSSA
ncbi:MAG: hypothetical protein K2Q45_00425 [Nitrosomonas sp.]|nr:hypothetical protein [Nitrosomonas sp.]